MKIFIKDKGDAPRLFIAEILKYVVAKAVK